MKITLVGVLVFIGIAALLVYVAGELQKANQTKGAQPPQNSDSSINP
jgi:hypothetical protein